MIGYLESLAASYARGWKQYRSGVSYDFVTIKTIQRIRVTPTRDIFRDSNSPATESADLCIYGRLTKGLKGATPPVTFFDSFHATVHSGIDLARDDRRSGNQFYMRNYPEAYIETQMQWR